MKRDGNAILSYTAARVSMANVLRDASGAVVGMPEERKY